MLLFSSLLSNKITNCDATTSQRNYRFACEKVTQISNDRWLTYITNSVRQAIFLLRRKRIVYGFRGSTQCCPRRCDSVILLGTSYWISEWSQVKLSIFTMMTKPDPVVDNFHVSMIFSSRNLTQLLIKHMEVYGHRLFFKFKSNLCSWQVKRRTFPELKANKQKLW